MMKRALLLALLVAACEPIDWGDGLDFDLGGGPIRGDRGVVTFALVDGCPSSDWLFGCEETMPALAVGARMRLVVGSVSGEQADEKRVEAATFRVSDPGIVAVGRDAEGLVVVQAVGHGAATIELRDADGGDLIDTIVVRTQPIASIEGEATADTSIARSTTLLSGARIGVKARAYGPGGEILYARGALTATLSAGLELDADNSGFFAGASEQLAVHGVAAGPATIRFAGGTASLDVPYTVVVRDQLTSVSVGELGPEDGVNKQLVAASVKVGDADVRGAPACDWRIVSGGGPGAALAVGVGDDTNGGLIVLFDSVLVYGAGDTIVECRANDHVIGQATVHLGP